MGNTLKKIRLFTIADFKKEEQWLRGMHRAGWKLVSMTAPCLFYFERCRQEDVIYQLDFRNRREGDGVEYRQMFRDCGWEYVDSCMSFHYFRKPVTQMDREEEIFSDNASRIDLLRRVWKWRMMPLFIIFTGCVLPQLHHSFSGDAPLDVIFVIYCVLALVYIWLILYVGIRLYQMQCELRRCGR